MLSCETLCFVGEIGCQCQGWRVPVLISVDRVTNMLPWVGTGAGRVGLEHWPSSNVPHTQYNNMQMWQIPHFIHVYCFLGNRLLFCELIVPSQRSNVGDFLFHCSSFNNVPLMLFHLFYWTLLLHFLSSKTQGIGEDAKLWTHLISLKGHCIMPWLNKINKNSH